MKLIQVTWQHRNDFEGILQCEHCQGAQTMKHGYHDNRFLNQVIPAIQCVSCGKRGNEVVPEGISDPGTQGGVQVSLQPVTKYEWRPV